MKIQWMFAALVLSAPVFAGERPVDAVKNDAKDASDSVQDTLGTDSGAHKATRHVKRASRHVKRKVQENTP